MTLDACRTSVFDVVDENLGRGADNHRDEVRGR